MVGGEGAITTQEFLLLITLIIVDHLSSGGPLCNILSYPRGGI